MRIAANRWWVLAWVLASSACTTSDAQHRADAPIPYLEVRTRGAAQTDDLPLVVALHGRGDRPEWFAGLFDDLPMRARIVIPHPPHTFAGGLAWYLDSRQSSGSRARIARELVEHAARIRSTVDAVRRARPTRGRPVLVGFSQGAMLAYTVAATQPEVFAAVFPIAGFFFRETRVAQRAAGSPSPRIVAWHGSRDRLVTLDDDRRGVERLRTLGITVELRENDSAHTIPPAVRAELFAEMLAILDGR